MRGKKPFTKRAAEAPVAKQEKPPSPYSQLISRLSEIEAQEAARAEIKKANGVVKDNPHVDLMEIRKAVYEVGAAIVKALEKR